MKKIYFFLYLLFLQLSFSVAQPCNTSINLALGKTAVSSSNENGALVAANAFDGNITSRWSSQYTDNEFIYVDLGAAYDLCEVKLRWETALGEDFTIDISSDAVTWTPVAAIVGNLSASNDLAIAGVARYVRMNGLKRATPFGYSLYEFEVIGKVPVCNTANAALALPATTSSVEAPQFPGSNAFDGNIATRWSSAYNDNESIYVDLGAPVDLCNVKITWETALGRDYDIQISNDAITWNTVGAVRNNTVLNNSINIVGNGRYVRMQGITRGTIYGYSIFEFEVYTLNLALPITLSQFKASKNNSNVLIEWTTQSEVNNKTFVVERSTDGRIFSPIAELPGAVNSSQIKKYQIIDNNAVKGMNYYRLKQIDKDAAFTYSKTVSVYFDGIKKGTAINIYPNPTSNLVHIATGNNSAIQTVKIFNTSGTMVKQVNAQFNTANLSISVQDLSSGVYIIEVKSTQETSVSKMIKQ